MNWPAPEPATVTILAGALELPVRAPRPEDGLLSPLAEPQTATPERFARVRPRLMRLDRLDLELGGNGKYVFEVADDPLGAVAEASRTETMRRVGWNVRIETWMRLSCTRDAFRLQTALRASEATSEVFSRDWDCLIPRDGV